MGASLRSFTVAAACCLGLLASQSALAESDGWLGRIGSVTGSLIPDINLSAYLDGSRVSQEAETGEQQNAGLIASQDVYLWQLDVQPGTDSDGSGFKYTLVDSDAEQIGSSAGVYLLAMDPNAHSTVGGLARSVGADSRLPTYGLDLAFAFAPRWSLGMRGHFLDIETSELDSSQSAYSANIEYAALDEMSVGFAYEQFETQADSQLVNFPGYVAYKYSGPRIYTTLRF